MSNIQPPDFASYFHTFRVYPDRAQMEQNATVFAAYLGALGFTINSACAMLGNWESECRINPNYPTSANFPTTRSGGFGLPHWTPWGRKIGDWALTNLGISPTATDDNPLSAIDVQMLFHEYSATTGRDWYSNEGFNYTWPGFKKSTESPLA